LQKRNYRQKYIKISAVLYGHETWTASLEEDGRIKSLESTVL
jgi:hypothetical protein